MNIRENVRIQWQDLRAEAIGLWRKDLDAVIYPEMIDRGFTIQSRTVRDPIDNNEVEVSWAFIKNDMYIWIDCRSHMGIFANLFPQNSPKESRRFPPPEAREDNMSFHKFFIWLDKQGV